jgi:capsular polysaccharide transport system permease protein
VEIVKSKNRRRIDIKNFFFIIFFLISVVYILFVKSELYESSTSVVIKDLNTKGTQIEGFALLTPTGSNVKSAFTMKTYLESYDELSTLDKDFDLKKHYMSEKIDIIQRLKVWNKKKEFLSLYRNRLNITFDDVSGILTIAFLHTDPAVAFLIINKLVSDANKKINEYNRVIAKKQLTFIKAQVQDTKKKLLLSTKLLKEFQNKYLMLDPTKTAQTQFSIVANLEVLLMEKKAKLNELMQYMNENNFEVVRVKNEIKETKKTLKKMKKALTSSDNKSLNIYIFEFERLKSMMELDKELYKQSLLQSEQIKTELNKNSKMLLVLTNPYLPDGYKYPQKLKDIVTIMLILLLLYGILSLISAIIEEHKD